MHYKSHHFGEESNNSFAVKIETLVREIVIQNEIPYYRIESGVEHLTDAGAVENLPVIRIITYFEDTVNKISHILHEEFDVDIEKSTDKKRIRIETFAYKNINYTARLTPSRQNQTEYKRAGSKKFEIQICSMLQDAWTGIEKELGYDSMSVPDEAKRDFYRVGALLEMADIEFLKIRTELGQRRKAQEAPKPFAAAEVHQPEAPRAEAPRPADNANTFVEHLQAVAREVQKEAPAPVQEFSKVLQPQPEAPRPQPAPQPVAQQPIYTPPPAAVQQPVVMAQPQPAPIQQPIAPPPAVAAQAPVVHTPAAQPIAPKPVATAPSQAGLAPKPVVPKAEPTPAKVVAADINNLKELASAINSAEARGTTAAPKQEPVVPKEPIAYIPPVVPEVPKVQDITPTIEKIIPPVYQAPATEAISNLNVNSNGSMHKAAELVQPLREYTERTVPLNTEQAKPKAIQLDDNAQMTDITLREFVMSSKLVKEIDQRIAERAGAKINTDVDIEGDVERLRFLKVYSLKQLHDRLSDNRDDIVAFAEKWIGKDNGGSFDSGICLFYLEYLLVGKRNDPAFAVEYVVKFISDNDYSARYIIPTYNSIHNTESASNFSHLTLRA